MAKEMERSSKLVPALIFLAGIVAIVIVASLFLMSPGPNGGGISIKDIDLKQFKSIEEFNAYVNQSQASGRNYYGRGEVMTFASNEKGGVAMDSLSSGSSASDYSTTNIQVEGVDEADIVKNDGKYIYAVSGSQLFILEAYPADNMRVVGEINFSRGYISNIFINDDRLVVFGSGLIQINKTNKTTTNVSGEMDVVSSKMISSDYYYPEYDYLEAVLVYDLKDRANPKLENSVVLDGNYVDSRMIGDYVYVVSNKYMYSDYPQPPIYYVNGVEKSVAVQDIYYPYFPDSGYQFTSVSAINLDSGEFDTKTYLLGTSYTIYVSEQNIYLTQYKSANSEDYMTIMIEDVYMEILPTEYKDRLEKIKGMDEYYDKERAVEDLMREWAKEMEGQEVTDLEVKAKDLMEKALKKISKLQGTAIYKVELDGMNIEYIASGFVPGTLLDQFSMDEYKGNLRVATTSGQNGWGMSSESMNNLYVLNEDLEIIGSVEDLAKGERVYSSRFMGERAYMVTFRQVDPLFVMDLSDPENPEVLGELKITGVSEYLHPYDENHIIGIGKEATEEGRFLGLKISLFDVSNVSNPLEVSKIEIGDRGTGSDALYDHKAVLFDKEKNLLVIPVDLYEKRKGSDSDYGEYTWSGVYVLDISPAAITVRGKISHNKEKNYTKYAAAKDEPIGAKRNDSMGNVWTKIANNEWEIVDADLNGSEIQEDYGGSYTGNYGFKDTTWQDYRIDQQPGGVEYHYYPNYQDNIRRSLYMDDVLYTISERIVKANHLDSLNEIKKVEMKAQDNYYYGGYYGGRGMIDGPVMF